jgi:GT2 family glycosyltransferase
MKDLSIVIINWNSADFTAKCLASIYARTPDLSFEVIVVDNASYDGVADRIGSEFPQAQFIQSEQNLGFAAANQLGAEYSKGRFLLFLNPDTEILGTAITDMVSSLQSLPDGGAIGCRLLNGDGTLQTTCVQSFPTIVNQCLDFEFLRLHFPSGLWGTQALRSTSNAPVPVEMLCGAALMIRRDVFEQIGGFSTDYFMYGEDADLCHKVWKAGWKIYYLPTAAITHYGGQSTKANAESSTATLLKQESLQIYFTRMYGKRHAAWFRMTRACTAIVRLAVSGPLMLMPAKKEIRAARRATFGKWWSILRWSLGLAKQVGPPPKARSPQALPTVPVESSREVTSKTV